MLACSVVQGIWGVLLPWEHQAALCRAWSAWPSELYAPFRLSLAGEGLLVVQGLETAPTGLPSSPPSWKRSPVGHSDGCFG